MVKKPSSSAKINIPTGKNKLLKKALNNVNDNKELATLWRVINVNAIDRLGMTDHGYVHFQIVANISLKILRSLTKSGVEMSTVKDYKLSKDHAELVVFLASIFHDLGMSISRENHEEFSLILANDLLKKTLDFLPTRERTIVTSEVLHVIISHRRGGKPLSLEAGIIRVADALDMSKGRSRIPYEAGKVDIHSVSAAAIENIEITEGKDKPIQINISMNNSAGVFQVDELLKSKLKGSGIEEHVGITAFVKGKKEKALLKEFTL